MIDPRRTIFQANVHVLCSAQVAASFWRSLVLPLLLLLTVLINPVLLQVTVIHLAALVFVYLCHRSRSPNFGPFQPFLLTDKICLLLLLLILRPLWVIRTRPPEQGSQLQSKWLQRHRYVGSVLIVAILMFTYLTSVAQNPHHQREQPNQLNAPPTGNQFDFPPIDSRDISPARNGNIPVYGASYRHSSHGGQVPAQPVRSGHMSEPSFAAVARLEGEAANVGNPANRESGSAYEQHLSEMRDVPQSIETTPALSDAGPGPSASSGRGSSVQNDGAGQQTTDGN